MGGFQPIGDPEEMARINTMKSEAQVFFDRLKEFKLCESYIKDMDAREKEMNGKISFFEDRQKIISKSLGQLKRIGKIVIMIQIQFYNLNYLTH